MPVTVTATVKGFSEAQAGAERALQMLREGPRLAMDDSVEILRSSLADITPMGPGRWGHLRDSYRTRVSGRGTHVTGRVSSNLPQGRWLQEGTHDHEIKPRNGRALKIGGQMRASAHVRGVTARDLKGRAEAAAEPQIIARFSALRDSAIKEFRLS